MRVWIADDGLPIVAFADDIPLARLQQAAAPGSGIPILRADDAISGLTFTFGWVGPKDRAPTELDARELLKLPAVWAAATPSGQRWGARIRDYLDAAVKHLDDAQLEQLAREGLATHVPEATKDARPEPEHGMCVSCEKTAAINATRLCGLCVMGAWVDFVNADDRAHQPRA